MSIPYEWSTHPNIQAALVAIGIGLANLVRQKCMARLAVQPVGKRHYSNDYGKYLVYTKKVNVG
jgi:hypothetical protein